MLRFIYNHQKMKCNYKKTFIFILIILLISVAYYLISPLFRVIEVNEAKPTLKTEATSTVLRANFESREYDVKGSAEVLTLEDGQVLRFENFETVNGPNLHIYLASDEEVTDYIDLGSIKGTKGSINYDLPMGIDLDKYNHVVVYCVPFKVTFGIAELK